ncbi:MAG: TolC family protein [Bacteroidetes bacterium]|nr:MAG: TolC family protein [Bacteroidota bacterium]
MEKLFYKMRAMRFRYCVLYVIALACLQGQARAQNTLTLQEALQIASQNNIQIRLAQNSISLAQSNNTRGNAGQLPTVNMTAGQDNSINNVRQQFLSGATNDRTGARNSTMQAGVEAAWTLWDGKRMFIARNRLQETVRNQQLLTEMQKQQTTYQVYRAYLLLVQQKQLYKLYEQAVELSSKRLKVAQDKWEAGKVAKTEVLRAQVDLNADKSQVLRQKTAIQEGKIALNLLLGRQAETDFEPSETVALPPTALTLASLQQEAESKNIAFQQLQAVQTINELQRKELEGEKQPQIDLRAGYNYNRQQSQAGFLLRSQSYGGHIGFSLLYPLFNGYDLRRRIQNNRITNDGLKIEREQISQNINQNLARAYTRYQNNQELLALEDENVKVAEQNFALAQDQILLGLTTSLELRTAQQNLTQALTRRTTAQYEIWLTEVDLLFWAGKL